DDGLFLVDGGIKQENKLDREWCQIKKVRSAGNDSRGHFHIPMKARGLGVMQLDFTTPPPHLQLLLI
ncbi:hypothetical protein HAX54_047544, partial [Datura stramonium]|nr:hypothetical protein [Datura stramonium]